MTDVTVKTNNHTRDLLAKYELTAKESEEFDYVQGDDMYSLRFVRAYGSVYDVNEFTANTLIGGEPITDWLKGWDGRMSESFFSGMLVRYVDSQCEQVVIGHYYG